MRLESNVRGRTDSQNIDGDRKMFCFVNLGVTSKRL